MSGQRSTLRHLMQMEELGNQISVNKTVSYLVAVRG